jgi:hypothetical protein
MRVPAPTDPVRWAQCDQHVIVGRAVRQLWPGQLLGRYASYHCIRVSVGVCLSVSVYVCLCAYVRVCLSVCL